MAKIITTIVVEDGMNFDDICSFETETYIGIYNHGMDAFMVMEKECDEFYALCLPVCDDLEELDHEVYKITEEHILEVYNTSHYMIVI